MHGKPGVEQLASYRRCVERIRSAWPAFLQARALRLEEDRRHGAAEKVTENIVEDLFTKVLDWSLADLNHQVQGADILLTKHGIKYLLIETKRPGALAWHRRAVEKALEQARRYAAEQRVRCIAVSDGTMLYAADMVHGGFPKRTSRWCCSGWLGPRPVSVACLFKRAAQRPSTASCKKCWSS